MHIIYEVYKSYFQLRQEYVDQTDSQSTNINNKAVHFYMTQDYISLRHDYDG